MDWPRQLLTHPVLAQLGFPTPSQRDSWSLADARAYCRQLTRSHYENFTVTSWLLPRRYWQAWADIYAFCRWADDLADEAGSPQLSLEWLDWWHDQLVRCWHGEAEHPVFVALAATRQEFPLSLAPFVALLDAFRRDQTQARYDTWAELLDYCRGSANPVGRLILQLTEVTGGQREEWSDAICSGLQIANFCQDVAEDYRRGRIYLPREEWARWGCREEDFAASRGTSELCQLVAAGVERAAALLTAGAPLLDQVPLWLRCDLDLFCRGGHAILQAIRRQRYDVWTRRPVLSRFTKLRLGGRAWLASWQARRSGQT